MRHLIGLMMVAGENDILERTLEHNAQLLDAFYVLDGSVPSEESERICRAHPKCWGYRTDSQLPHPEYPVEAHCGYRQFIYQLAVGDHGHDNWFMVLHADEVWTHDPRDYMGRSAHDGFVYHLPFFFPRAGEEWREDVHPLDQLHWSLWPGWPEFRLFLGREDVAYDPHQRFNTAPAGIRNPGFRPEPILHYPYRAPEVQRARAEQHVRTQFDPDNYLHILNEDGVYWTDAMIQDRLKSEWYSELREEVLV